VTDIIFEYEVPETNWLNPIWCKFEKQRRRDEEMIKRISQVIEECPNISVRSLLRKTSINSGAYYRLKGNYFIEDLVGRR